MVARMWNECYSYIKVACQSAYHGRNGNQSINQSFNQSINQSINHYIKSMINQLIDAWFCINSLRASRTRPMTFNLFTSQFLGISRGLTVYDLLSVVQRER